MFLAFISPHTLSVVPDRFLRDMYRALSAPQDGVPPKITHYSPMLHCALISVAAGLSDDPDVKSLETRAKFADEAKKLMDEECKFPSIAAVQGVSLLAMYHKANGDQCLGYVYFGQFFSSWFGVWAANVLLLKASVRVLVSHVSTWPH